MAAPIDVAIVGGGPAGAAAGRLLATWGHAVTLLDKGHDSARGLAESIPPSTRKLLEQVGVADAIDGAGFVRTGGNTAWWGSRDGRVETFGDGRALGYQVFRPDFDRVMLATAMEAGVDVRPRSVVRRVTLDEGERARVEYDQGGGRHEIAPRFVLDCSGRAGVIGRRFRVAEPSHRTFALVGVWTRGDSWGLPDDTHTVVETFAEGWAWSVPISAATRHVAAMVGRTFDEDAATKTLIASYDVALARTKEIARLVRGAILQRVWACDASLYSSTTYAGPQYFLVGDAGSFIDPLSSFGIKKALASAWIAAVATHTALQHADRASVAAEFFIDWERRVYASHLRRTQTFARSACAEHGDVYWQRRAAPDVFPAAEPDEATSFAEDPAVRRAFEALKAAPRIDLVMTDAARLEQRPIIRDHEIVIEPALAGGMRYVGNVDLLALARMAPQHAHVPDLFDAYCRICPPVPLPSVVGGLSLLVAKGILHERI